jgi:CHAD domain-containing protein
MATGSTIPGSPVEHRGLSYWMERVLKELEKVRTAPAPDAVHDLRVALRRCRSLAAVIEEVDPDPAWPEMRKLGRKLFRQLGELRDTQVLGQWVGKLGNAGDAVGQRLHAHLEKIETEERDAALRAAAKFDEKSWKDHERALRRRVRLVPTNSLAAESLALERMHAAKDLHLHALRTEKPEPWHALRIGVKRFRYTVESLLPRRYESWGDDLKHVQDLLGEVHDLDVLGDTISQLTADQPDELRSPWRERIAAERQARLEEYRQHCMGPNSLWQTWKEGLPHGRRMEGAALARLRATARALDAARGKNLQVARLAMSLFERLGRVKAAAVFENKNARKVMRAGARLHGIGVGLRAKSPQKAARKFLRGLSIPVAWNEEEWELLTLAVRYYRGEEPKPKHKAYARLGKQEQEAVRAMAGVLRLARALRKFGVLTGKDLQTENTLSALILRVPGLEDTAASAAKIAAAKHLLQSVLDRPLIVQTAPRLPKIVELPKAQEPLSPTAAASD